MAFINTDWNDELDDDIYGSPIGISPAMKESILDDEFEQEKANMNIEDIKQAREEAKKFIKYVDDLIVADKEKERAYYTTPAESGLVKAQSIILSRTLSAMRNPWTCKRGKRG